MTRKALVGLLAVLAALLDSVPASGQTPPPSFDPKFAPQMLALQRMRGLHELSPYYCDYTWCQKVDRVVAGFGRGDRAGPPAVTEGDCELWVKTNKRRIRQTLRVSSGGNLGEPETADGVFDGVRTVNLLIPKRQADVLPGQHVSFSSVVRPLEILAYDPRCPWDEFLRSAIMFDGRLPSSGLSENDPTKPILDLLNETAPPCKRIARVYLSDSESVSPVRIEHYYYQEKAQIWYMPAFVRDLEFFKVSGGRLFLRRGTLEVYRGKGYEPGTKPVNVTSVDVRRFLADSEVDDSSFRVNVPVGFKVRDGIVHITYTKGFSHLTAGLPGQVITGDWILRDTK